SKKLQWMNNQYIKTLTADQVNELTLPHLIEAGRISADADEETKAWAINLIALYKDQLSYGAEIVELTELFFQTKISYNEDAQAVLAEEQVAEVLNVFKNKLTELENWEPQAIKTAV